MTLQRYDITRTHQSCEPYMGRTPDGGYVRYNKYQELEARTDELLKSIEEKLDSEAMSLGAVDGYDYNSGVEYGLRLAAIIVGKARIDK